MREGPTSEVLAGAAGWRPVATSRLDGVVLADEIPITSGRYIASADSPVPDRIEFTVKEFDRGRSWVPDSPTHPLARFGQRIELAIEVTAPVSHDVTSTPYGTFQVHSWEWDDDGQVRVTALGMLQRVAEAKFRVPEVPRSGGTFGSELRRLMIPGLSVGIDTGLTDRAIPQSFVWETDRLGALYEIADAWPARLRTDQWGQVRVLPPLDEVATPAFRLTDGQGGTVIKAPRSDTREQDYTVVVGQATATDSPAREAITRSAEVTSGPKAVAADGSGYGEVVRYASSPLTTTAAQVQTLAANVLANGQRRTTVRRVQCAPDPRIELDDAGSVTRLVSAEWGYVVGIDMPLTINDGPMVIDLGVRA